MVLTRSGKQKCLVVGGAGFLGRHLVDALVDEYSVSIFDVRESGDPNVNAIVGDIVELQNVVDACRGMDVVFHCATVAPQSEDSRDRALAHAVNVLGTQNVIQACHNNLVPKLVYTSSASVVFDGSDLNNVNETAPYAKRTLDYYTETKIKAEKLVLAANGVRGLATVALRPSGIFGEWDKLLVPVLVRNAKRGKMKYIIGSGRNLMEFTYAGNVADAHLLAARKLEPGSVVAGQAYFVTNDEPVPFWGFLGDILEPLGYGRPRIKLPALPLLFLALVFEWVVVPLVSPFAKISSDFTTSRIKITAANRQISCERAKRELGYQPRVSIKEGLQRTVAHFQPLAKGQEYHKVHRS